MDVKRLLWEGPTPVTPPNTGRHVQFAWGLEDWREFQLSVSAAYPNVFFYEGLKNSEESGEAEPPLTPIERLDQSRRGRKIEMCFPAPEWVPRLIRTPNKWGKLHWTFDQYWSPRIWFGSPTAGPSPTWQSEPWRIDGVAPVEVWASREIQSSFRRQFAQEVKCEAKIMNLARKIGRRMVSIRWESLADYLRGIGRVDRFFPTSASYFASASAVDWYRQGGSRLFNLRTLNREGLALSHMPPEDVPDHFWGDVKKPKWVLEAIEKYRR